MGSPDRDFRAGAGRICLDFIRTLRHRGRPCAEEELSTPALVDAWMEQFGPCEFAVGQASDRDVTARALREAIDSLVTAAHSAAGITSCPRSARESVNTAAARPTPEPYLDAHGRLRFRAQDPTTATLAVIARDALDLVSSPQLTRIRRCANPDCQILFLDQSRPGTRRWCSMSTCGNQAKKSAQRVRTTTRPPRA
jgi:predicted RNA-binding Zn ribbon-like protein